MDLGYSDNKVEVLSSINVPKKYFERISTGIALLDEVFGGPDLPGILPGASLLFTGFPGAGKSTMALQLADLIQTHSGKSVLYNVGEENRYMVKMAADRLGLRQNFCVSAFDDVLELTEYCSSNNIDVLFQDSIQTLKHDELNGLKLLKTLGNKLAAFAGCSGTTCFIIGHITKSGEFAGPMNIKHALDVHCHLSLDKETNGRVFELTKNRFGPAFQRYEFLLSADGLDFRQINEDPTSEKKMSKTVEKKQAFIDKAKELMLAGEKLNGYSSMGHSALMRWMEKEGYDCSGGFWRGILVKAAASLRNEGHKVMERKLPRAGGGLVSHLYVEV